jgi:hypothetical protein
MKKGSNHLLLFFCAQKGTILRKVASEENLCAQKKQSVHKVRIAKEVCAQKGTILHKVEPEENLCAPK